MHKNIHSTITAEAPKYLQVKQYIIDKIVSGEFAPKSRIPSLTKLSSIFDVNKNTVVRALNELAMEKYISQKQGLGSFVEPRAKRNLSYNLGVIVYNIDSPIYSKIIRSIDDNCRKHSFHVIPISAKGNYEQEKSIITDLANSRKVDGILLFPANGSYPSGDELEFLQGIVRSGLPIVVYNSAGKLKDISTMGFDIYEGVRASVIHLFENGFKKIGLVTCNPHQHNDADQRLFGYRSGLEACGLQFDEDNVIIVDVPEEKYGYDIADGIIDLQERPEALVVISDEVAVGLMNRMFERGIKVPGDISIIGGGNIDIGQHPLYSLSTIAPDFSEIGNKVSDVLIEQAVSGNMETSNLFFRQKIIARKSSMNDEQVMNREI